MLKGGEMVEVVGRQDEVAEKWQRRGSKLGGGRVTREKAEGTGVGKGLERASATTLSTSGT